MTVNTLRNLVSTALLSALTAMTFAACGGGNKHVTNTGGGGSGSAAAAACTPEECAAVAEPPIAPNSCGEGHEKDIGTACQRSAAGACEKVLQCNGAAPAATP